MPSLGNRKRVPEVSVAVGALVPPSVELRALPDQAAAGDPSADLLKYAMVENTIVVVVDPVTMRVVGIIRTARRTLHSITQKLICGDAVSAF